METLSPKEQNEIQMAKLFNTSEEVVKLWVSKFTGKDPEKLFDFIPPTEPVYFYPSDNTGGKYVKLQLEIVPHDYNTTIDEKLVCEKIIQDTIHFFVYSMKIVYSSVMKTSERSAAHDVCLRWNPEKYRFDPEFFPDLKKKSDYLEYVFRHMMLAKENIPENRKEEWVRDFASLNKDIQETNKQMEKEKIQEKIEEKRLEWSDIDRVGVVISYLTEEQLPEKVKSGILKIKDEKYSDPPGESDNLENLVEGIGKLLKNNKPEDKKDTMSKDEEHVEAESKEEKNKESKEEAENIEASKENTPDFHAEDSVDSMPGLISEESDSDTDSSIEKSSDMTASMVNLD